PAARPGRPARERASRGRGPAREARAAVASARQGPAAPEGGLTTMTRHTARVSRTGLAIIGLILLLGGGAVLARGRSAATSVLGSPHAPLLTHGQAQYPVTNSWVWPVVAAASFLIALLALWWMMAQAKTRALRRLPLEPDR